MKTPLQLFIGTFEVEFSTPPEILYSYKVSELNNPTIVKNSFSKTITIDGTPENNKIFGQYWNLNRMQMDGDVAAGTYFNASKKVPFRLFVGSEIAESGYVKLEKINRAGNFVSYEITLFGGLGEFFYSLTYDENGNKLKLSDLNFTNSENPDSEFDFTINKETINDAWDPGHGGNPLWEYINFAPCYNGIPDSLDADKVLINEDNLQGIPTSDGEYHFEGGYSVGTLNEKITEWECRDLRSYLQRPILNVMRTLDAIFEYAKKNGFDVDLDEDFFYYTNEYYARAWMTLPMLTELEFSSKEKETGTLSASSRLGDVIECQFNVAPSDLRWTSMQSAKFSVKLRVTANSNADTLYTSWQREGNFWHNSKDANGAVFLQAVAYNSSNGVVGASPVYRCGNGVEIIQQAPSMWNTIYDPETGRYTEVEVYGNGYADVRQVPLTFTERYQAQGDAAEIEVPANFKKRGAYYYLTKAASGSDTFNFDINTNGMDINSIKVFVYFAANKNKVGSYGGRKALYYLERSSWSAATPKVSITDVNVQIVSSTAVYTKDDKVGTGCFITKRDLLKTDYTPADFLLSYSKLFGLYFVKDTDRNTIHIVTRGNFFDNENILNLEERLDRSKDFNIQPITFDSKWYDLSLEVREGQYAKDYDSSNAITFGTQRLNTGYNLGSDTKNLYEKSIFKTAVSCVEDSRYFLTCNGVKAGMGYEWLCGMSYTLYKGDTTKDKNVDVLQPNKFKMLNTDYERFYDIFDKPQFHDKAGKAIDGSNVLLLENGTMYQRGWTNTNNVYYYISDDMAEMKSLNGNPCWLYTQSSLNKDGKRIAYRIDAGDIPTYSRYSMTGNLIRFNFDFGQTTNLFIPKALNRDNSAIYHYFWKNYLTDLYDINNRVLTCYVRMDGKPNPDWLRRFYWFDNSIWRLNEITDWNVSSEDTVKMQFIKVLDEKTYDNTFVTRHRVTIEPEVSEIGQQGGDVKVFVHTMSGERWWVSESASATPMSGVGDGYFIWHIPENRDNADRELEIGVEDENDSWAHAKIMQSGLEFNILVASTDFGYNGGSVRVEVKSKGGWTATHVADWITPRVKSGTGSTAYNYTILANNTFEERSVFIIFEHVSGLAKAIEFTQSARPITGLTIEVHGTEIPENGGSLSATIYSGEEWDIVDAQDFTIKPMEGGAGRTEVTITLGANRTQAARVEHFIVRGLNSGTMVVSQNVFQDKIDSGGAPYFNLDNCISCGECAEMCRLNAASAEAAQREDTFFNNCPVGVGPLRYNDYPEIIGIDACISCGACLGSFGEHVGLKRAFGGTCPTGVFEVR